MIKNKDFYYFKIIFLRLDILKIVPENTYFLVLLYHRKLNQNFLNAWQSNYLSNV
jgi:hypothetical protein